MQAISSALVGVILVANKFKLIKMEVQIYLAFHYVRWIMPIAPVHRPLRWDLKAMQASQVAPHVLLS